jgi:SOUL heme-binding protein
MMMRSTILVVSSLILGLAGPVMGDNPWFCHDLNCPKFTTVSKHSGYDIREYPSQKWVSTTVPGIDWKTATDEGFMRLFHYIESHSVKMTAPVTNVIQPGQGPKERARKEHNYTKRLIDSDRVAIERQKRRMNRLLRRCFLQ